MRHHTLILAALCLVSLTFAADPPRTKAGRSAIERYSAAKAKLDAEYQARFTGLQRQLAVDLRAAIKVATRNGDLEDAQALQEYLDKLVGRTYTFQIDAAKDWQPTIEVEKGQKIRVDAEGEWSGGVAYAGPDGRVGSYYLEARIGDQLFRVGRGADIDVHQDGTLEMRMHDDVFDDNEGAITVTVSAGSVTRHP